MATRGGSGAALACEGDFARALRDDERRLRPFIEQVQAEAVRVGVETFVPRTEAICRRNAQTDDPFGAGTQPCAYGRRA